MRDDTRENKEVLDHLRRENSYGEQQLSHLDELRDTLYNEHLGHLKQTDTKPASLHGEYFYYRRSSLHDLLAHTEQLTKNCQPFSFVCFCRLRRVCFSSSLLAVAGNRTEEGKSYPLHCRCRSSADQHVPGADALDEVVLDENRVFEEAKDPVTNAPPGHCDVGCVRVSPCHNLVAYTVDLTGDEIYSLVVRRIADQSVVEQDGVSNMTADVVWGSKAGAAKPTLLYLTQDKAQRPYRLWLHELGLEVSALVDDDAMLFEEKDELYYLDIGRSLSGEYAFLNADSVETSEVHILHCEPGAHLTVLKPREFGLRYTAEHNPAKAGGGEAYPLLVVTNADGALNNKLMAAKLPPAAGGPTERQAWIDVLPYAENRMIEDVLCFEDHVALSGREGGFTQIWILDKTPNGEVDPSSLRRLEFDEPIFEVGFSVNRNASTHYCRIFYSSLKTPTRWLDVDMRSGASPRDFLIKEDEVLEYDPSLYKVWQVFAEAPDKTKIPISLVCRKEIFAGEEGGTSASNLVSPVPCMLYGYGSYGVCIDPCFHANALPYLDRGMIYAIAHVRGGGEMGRYWYEHY